MSRYYKRAQNIGWFVIEVDTTIAGTTGVGNFELRFGTVPTLNCNIVWGDGIMNRNVTATITHNYASAGIYKVAVVGVLPRVSFFNTGDRLKVKKILSWGDARWSNALNNAFWGCNNLDLIAEVTKPVNEIINGFAMFSGCNLSEIPEKFTLPFLQNGGDVFLNNNLQSLPSGMTLSVLTSGGSLGMFRGNQLSSLPSGMNLPLLIDGTRMFRQNQLTDLPAGMVLPNLTNGTEMFFGNTINTTRYSQLLVDLDANNANTNVPFHGGSSKYNSIGYIGRHNLITNKTWTITDGGVDTSVVFQLEIDTTIAGTTGVGNFELRGFGTRQYTVDWGDGNVSTGLTGNVTHTYAVAGVYTISVAGLFPRVFYNNLGDKDKVKKILSFGDIVWGASQNSAFFGCGITDINGIINNGQAVSNFVASFAVMQLASIPTGLFDNCPNVTDFSFCFRVNQINTIPQGLFDNCPLVTNFARCFDTNGLIPNCPSDLFANNPLANNFNFCFQNSTLPTATYSDMLVSLDQNNANTNVPFHGGNSTYTGAAAIAARANLVNVKGWNIIDGGQV
jgi:hypothetical protein